MLAPRRAVVTATQGNVIYCSFGAAAATPGPAPADVDAALAGIRCSIAEINSIVTETLAIHGETSALEKDVRQLVLKALDSMDIVAFQSRILLAAGDHCSRDAGFVASTLWRFVSAGVAVSQRLHALAGEHRTWMGAEARVLREVVAQAERLETTAGDCIHAMRAADRDGQPPI